MKLENTIVILGAIALTVSAGSALAFERGQVRETQSMAPSSSARQFSSTLDT